MTPIQQTLLHFITDFQKANAGLSPNYVQMLQHIGLKSKSNIARYLDLLEAQGHITRTRGAVRSITVTGKCPACGRAA